jgi:hypothetical protein
MKTLFIIYISMVLLTTILCGIKETKKVKVKNFIGTIIASFRWPTIWINAIISLIREEKKIN